ncbi:hypothetical protein BASA81_007959 [Batrachochytrium salamandrivorans]|nr:hypothetical protein BASA81_007959 [Batrachochytrium salamandrivorans]
MGRPSSRSSSATDSPSKFHKKAVASFSQFATSSPASSQLSHMLLGSNPVFSTLQDELATVELDVKKRMASHLSKAESKVDELRSTMNNALLCLPREIQNMNVQEYIQRYGGSREIFVENALSSSRLQQVRRTQDTAKKAISRSAQKKALLSSSTLLPPNTPAQSIALQQPGSVLQSRKTPGGTLNSKLTVSISSQPVDLTPGKLGLLNSEQRREAAEQIDNLAAQVDRIKAMLHPK